MNNQLDLRDLRYFETIAELGNLRQAAQKVFRSQPALTGCIHRLEESFGTPLFERVGRGVRLTPAGDVLLAHAKRLHLVAEDAAREMTDIAHGHAGHIKIGVEPSVAQLLMPAVARVYLTETKDVTLKMVVAQSDVLRASLKAGNLDIIISFDREIDEHLVSVPILEDSIVVVASSSHEVFCKPVKLRELVAHEWVLASPSVENRQWLDRAFESRGLPKPKAKIETNLILLLPSLIAQTGLLSFLSRKMLSAKRIGSLLKEVCLKETTMRRSCKVIYRKNSYLSPAVQGLLKLLCTHGKKLSNEEF